MIWIIYNFLFPFGFLLFLPYFILRMSRRGGYKRNFGQRLGFYDADTRQKLAEGGRVWLHAVSVGEVFVAFQFMEEMRRRRPAVRFMLSTTTSTGYALAGKRLARQDVLIYFPVDFVLVMRRVLNLARPSAILLVECEFWPNMIRMARQRGIPVALVNGRISARSFKGYHRLRLFMRPLLQGMNGLGAQSEADARRLLDLGAPPNLVKALGSAKYDLEAPDPEGAQKARALLRAAGLPDDGLVLLGGSTWAGEEAALLDIYQALAAAGMRNLSLVLAPRHVERSPEVLAEISARGLSVLRRSELGASSGAQKRPDVLLVDTTGELKNLYTCADVIFVGKSLAQHGGQNIIEPAVCGKAVVVGPHMENFPAITEDFLAAQALAQVQDVRGLQAELERLLREPSARADMGKRAAALVRAKAGAVKATVDWLEAGGIWRA